MDYLNFILSPVFQRNHDSLQSLFKSALEMEREKSMKLGVCFMHANALATLLPDFRDQSTGSVWSGFLIHHNIPPFLNTAFRPWGNCEPSARCQINFEMQITNHPSESISRIQLMSHLAGIYSMTSMQDVVLCK